MVADHHQERRARLAQLKRTNPPLDCPECDGELTLRYSPKNDGYFYGCTNYPSCKATHGAHKETGAPLGVPGDKETKTWRIRAHEVFDRLWKGPGPTMSRSNAYAYAAGLMELRNDEMHIARFDIDQCKKLIAILENRNIVAPDAPTVEAEPTPEPDEYGRKIEI